MQSDTPAERCIHEERVKYAVESMPPEDDIATMAARFKAIS